MSRTYEEALSQLAALQSNRAITSLFDPTPAAAGDNSSNTAGSKAKPDLNALAIPEMIAWLNRAGLTQDDLSSQLRCVHVAGTKGKGSVCAYLTSILTRPAFRAVAGRVGTYTSPHLVTVRERIMLDGEPISQDLFARYFFEVWDAMTSWARAEYLRQQNNAGAGGARISDEVEAELRGPATKPFYFRFLTIMAFHVFLKEGVRSAVVECGIGGEYDSTNILPRGAVTVGVVTQLGIDHVGMLGRTLPEIAWHKIGIAKHGRVVVTRRLEGGPDEEEAMRVMRQRVAQQSAILMELTDGEVEAKAARWAHNEENHQSLQGQFQKYNRALASAAASVHLKICESQGGYESLSEEILAQEVSSGLGEARLRGRCETREDGNITWLIDGAHTAESLHEVAKWFEGKLVSHADARKVLIFNQQERDAGKLVEILCAGISTDTDASKVCPFDEAIFARNDLQPRATDEEERDLSVQETASKAFQSIYQDSQTSISDNVSDAVNKAISDGSANKKTFVVVTGSLHLVGALLQILEPEAPR